jgi:short-subunit dehydrogenase
MKVTNKKVFITGGSAGIGQAIIEELINYGVNDIAVMGRTAEKMAALEEQFPSVEFLKIQGDVSKLEDVKSAVQTVKEEWGALDILVNNAGVVSAGLLEDISDEDIISQVNVNVNGLVLMTKHFLPLLKESEDTAIMNISSGLGYIAMPFYSVYAATKAAAKHFSEAMRRELADHPIHVMTVYPTATDTEMMETAKVEDMDSPQKVAKAAVTGLIDEEIEVILGGDQQKEIIQMNLEEPAKVDEKVKAQFNAIQKRAEEHRSM